MYAEQVAMNGFFEKAVTVSDLNEHIKRLIDGNLALSDVYCKGEISNFKNHYATGHFYFSIKDEKSIISCVMFNSYASKLAFVPEDGMKVIVHGKVSTFIRTGQYQIYVDAMEPDGKGALYLAYEQLKRKLEVEGLFDESRKKPLPKIPSTVGIITSDTGAAIRDMINISKRRFPYAKLLLYPSLVQGPGAAEQLTNGIDYFNNAKNVDVIIIGRGGGSFEDLFAFNDETLCRHIAASKIPVVSAVGHETDFTISDFVSDRRAPTPSAAAEIVLPDMVELMGKFNNIIYREKNILLSKISANKTILEKYKKSHALSNPMAFIDDKKMELSNLAIELEKIEKLTIDNKKNALKGETGKLNALNPLAIIERGYSVVYDENDNIVKSIKKVSVGDKIKFRTSDGFGNATVDKTELLKKEKVTK